MERAINRLRGYRAVATRYDKREFVYKGTIDVASIGIWLRQPADQDPRDHALETCEIPIDKLLSMRPPVGLS